MSNPDTKPFIEVTVYPRSNKDENTRIFTIGNETSIDNETGKDYGIQSMLYKIAGHSILFNAIPNREDGSIDLGVDSYTGDTTQEYFDVVMNLDKRVTSWSPEKGNVENIDFRYVDPTLITKEATELQFQEA